MSSYKDIYEFNVDKKHVGGHDALDEAKWAVINTDYTEFYESGEAIPSMELVSYVAEIAVKAYIEKLFGDPV